MEESKLTQTANIAEPDRKRAEIQALAECGVLPIGYRQDTQEQSLDPVA